MTLGPGAEVRPALPADRTAWDAFVEARPEGDPLQLWAWGDVVGPTGERPLRLVLEDDGGRLRGLASALVRPTSFGRSLIYVPHGPLWDRDDPDAVALLRTLLDGLRDLSARSLAGIAVKLDPRAIPGGPDASSLRRELTGLGLVPARFDLQAPTTRIVDLADGGETLWTTWHADARRLARRSAREGVAVEVRRDADPASVAAFHGLLEATATRASFRPRDLAFLERAAAGLATDGRWYLVLARLQGRPIAGMIMPRVADRAYYLYGASLREPGLRHAYGAYAAMAEAMRVLGEDGVRTLDLWGVVERDDAMGGGNEASWEGFSAFKRSFGGLPVRHPGTFDLVVAPTWYRLRDWRERLRDTVGGTLGRPRRGASGSSGQAGSEGSGATLERP
jgi:lipid II:glycine glycyltransferase (peptidoglycan interpeptide bridge formation enzyme)